MTLEKNFENGSLFMPEKFLHACTYICENRQVIGFMHAQKKMLENGFRLSLIELN